MPRKKAEEEVESSEKDAQKNVSEAFKVLDKINPLSTMMETALSNIDSFISSGCYALDAMISGRIIGGGFPEGRMATLMAASSVGKSYIGVRTAAIAQKAGKMVVIFDSENAIEKNFCSSLGLDLSKCKYFPVRSIEQCKNAIYQFLSYVMDNGLQGKFFILVDSLGAMISELQFKRAGNDSEASDMGSKSKALGEMITMMNNMSGQSKTTVLCTNHIYENPNSMFPTVEKNQSGGHAAKYYPTTVVQLEARKVKSEDKEILHNEELVAGSMDAVGIDITAKQIKSRVCRPYIKCNLFLSWTRGISRYYGLLDMAESFGVVENRRGKIYKIIDGEEKFLGNRREVAFSKDILMELVPEIQQGVDKNWLYPTRLENDEEDDW